MEKVWPVEFVPNAVSSVPPTSTLGDDETTSELSDHSDEQTTNNASDDSDDQTTNKKSDDPDDQTTSYKNDDSDDQTASNKNDDSERRSCYLSAIGDRSRYDQNGDDRLVIDPETGKLTVQSKRDRDESSLGTPTYICTNMCSKGFFGGLVVAPSEKDKLMIKPRSWFKRAVTVETMHISCKSDTYQPGHNYAGVIIYQYNGKSEWKTANNTHCKTGYIVIQNTDSENVGRLTREEPGMVHGAVYRNAFGEPVMKSVVGEGFAIHDGMMKFNSGVFNNPQDSAFHDHRKRMHELSEHCVEKIVRHWMNEGSSWIEKRNFEIKELLEDCPCIPDYNPYGHNNKRSCNIM